MAMLITLLLLLLLSLSSSFLSGLIDFQRVRAPEQTFLIYNSATNFFTILLLLLLLFVSNFIQCNLQYMLEKKYTSRVCNISAVVVTMICPVINVL
jgi:hypothetical protein